MCIQLDLSLTLPWFVGELDYTWSMRSEMGSAYDGSKNNNNNCPMHLAYWSSEDECRGDLNLNVNVNIIRDLRAMCHFWIWRTDGIPWWSPSQVLATNYSVCALLCPVLIIAAHLGNKVIFYQLSPQTLLVTVNSCNVTKTILSPSVPETVSTRENKSQKSRRSWGANPWHPALQASALATRPPWIDIFIVPV